MDSKLFDLSGKVAVVTGASKGIGAGIAKGFGAAGASPSGAGFRSSRTPSRRCGTAGPESTLVVSPGRR